MKPNFRVVWIALILALSTLSSRLGWTEEETLHLRRGDAQQRRCQLSGLIGTWLFSLDMSLTTPGSIWYSPTLKSYRIIKVRGDAFIALAYGVHQEDESEFTVSVLPTIINKQRYVFHMQDEDYMSEETGEPANPACLRYQFNQEGHNILGYFQMYEAEGRECTDRLYAVGILTGERHQPATDNPYQVFRRCDEETE